MKRHANTSICIELVEQLLADDSKTLDQCMDRHTFLKKSKIEEENVPSMCYTFFILSVLEE